MSYQEEKTSLHLLEDLKKYRLVDIKEIIPDIFVDLKYAGSDNFTGQVVYRFHQALLVEEVAQALKNAFVDLEKINLSLKVWDAFRPMQAQKKFWEICPDERYVSHPKKGGRHTRGTAVDLTLCSKDACNLEMPTPFDEFSERAHRNFSKCSLEAQKNRQILEDLMHKHGFVGLATEWWHFDFQSWREYPVIEV